MAKQHGVCALCRKEADLELSHIVPKMVVRELKKTSVGQLGHIGARPLVLNLLITTLTITGTNE